MRVALFLLYFYSSFMLGPKLPCMFACSTGLCVTQRRFSCSFLRFARCFEGARLLPTTSDLDAGHFISMLISMQESEHTVDASRPITHNLATTLALLILPVGLHGAGSVHLNQL
ncbi:hypothetical protein COO60DRAFT_808186 [Scenedesmus sp. NREL 46B-D3]|nr:hypothetical protein COO60DRAFT_808186 [Scenedesmus sp. NREL 46B-D3]